MKRILTWLITVVMVLGLVPMVHLATTQAASSNRHATMVANRWTLCGYDRYGRVLPDNKLFPWQRRGQSVWGRPEFPMPYALRAVNEPPEGYPAVQPIPPATPVYSVPAGIISNSTVTEGMLRTSGLYCQIWLTVIADNGKSNYEMPWYVVMDNYGQVWFDPDGVFHDPRYFAYADPYNVNYNRVPTNWPRWTWTGIPASPYPYANCKDNPKALVDPIVANNTQGPYIFDPDYNSFSNPQTTSIFTYHSENYKLNNMVAPEFESRIYFWDTNPNYNTKRLWKLGWADMTDYLAVNAPGPAGILSNGEVYAAGQYNCFPQDKKWKGYSDWDVNLPLTDFTINLDPNSIEQHSLAGSVLHTENVSYATNYPDGTLGTFTPIPAHTPQYDFGEYIYQKDSQNGIYPANGTGYGRYLSCVDQGDSRLSDVVTVRNSSSKTYPKNTACVEAGILGLWEPGDDYDVGPTLWAFGNTNLDPNMRFERYFDHRVSGVRNNAYDIGEFIYWDRDILGRVNGTQYSQCSVTAISDIRLTNVNGWQNITNDHSPNPPSQGGTLTFDTDGLMRAGCWSGDLLLMAEVLDGGCLASNAPYDIAIESDAWIGWFNGGYWTGVSPALTAAAIYSHFDQTINHFNRVQKDVVLAQQAAEFFVPATIFQNVHFEERQFAGWNVWLDDGVDNNVAPNTAYSCQALDLSQNVEIRETQEQYVGSNSLDKWDFDYGRGSVNDLVGNLVAFSNKGQIVGPRYAFFDVNGDNVYGCGEHIYRDMDENLSTVGNTMLSADHAAGVSILDVDSTLGFAPGEIIVIQGDNTPVDDEIFQIAAILSATQIQLGTRIQPPPAFFPPFDITAYDHGQNRTVVEVGGLSVISIGDLRLTDVTVYRGNQMYLYYAGSTVTVGDLDIGGPIVYFTPINGFDYFFYDIPHAASGIPLNNQYDPGEDIYFQPFQNASINYRSIRYTEVEIQGRKYSCGTVVSMGAVLAIENPVKMISMGHNGLAHYMDFEVLPGKIELEVKIDQPLMVEQTSHIEIRVNPAPTKPTDKIYILIENLPRADLPNVAEVYRVIDREHPVINLEITPYRGSCDLTGFIQDRKVYVHAFKEESDMNKFSGLLMLPSDGGYYDPYWKKVYRDPEKRAYANYARYIFDSVNDQRHKIYKPLLGHLAGSFDCYGIWDSTVQPENLIISANRKCLTIHEQRFPNLVLSLTNWDNPNDVNDPANVRLATQQISDQAHRVNVNAHGAGVKFLFTADNLDYTQKYIIQVNDDDTFIVWWWHDLAPIDLLSPLDYLFYRDTVAPARNGVRLPTAPEPEAIAQKGTANDLDCSGRQATCDICGEEQNFLPIGSVTTNDSYGNAYINFIIRTYGVPTMVTDYGFLSNTDPGGQLIVCVLPRNTESDLWIRVTSEQTIFNYNSKDGQLWPPNGPSFLNDYTAGVDYCGLIRMKVIPPDPDVNFTELTWVDHALQYSQCNYTTGYADAYHTDPLHRLRLPTPQIQIPYNPLVYDYTTEIRAYPGGQTHPWRLRGPNSQRKSGFNAYPAIHDKQFYKLGTEFFPLTDYGMYFVLKNGAGEHLSFTPMRDNAGNITRPDLYIRRITIEGPFMRPRFMNADQNNYLANNYYNGYEYLPIQYDTTGQLIVDETNYTLYENTATSFNAGQFATITSPYLTNANPIRNSLIYPTDTNIPINLYLNLLDRQLDYTTLHWANIGPYPAGASSTFSFDEIIPINYGNIKITVDMYNGKKKIYQDCCGELPVDGFNVHGLDIQGAPKELEVDTDNSFEISLKEYEDIQVVQECNNAVVFCWQDRGIKYAGGNIRYGIGDGWITNPPRNSNNQSVGWQYNPGDDINGDGKITFNAFETEVIGRYDMSSNTWTSGIIDARTYQRQDGIYKFDMRKDWGNQLDEVGFDFGGGSVIGGRFSTQDHTIGWNEELPLWITAYKYGDDDNDRSFQPFHEIPPISQFGNPGFSHEVYLAAQTSIQIVGRNDLFVTTTPPVLTAGVTPELVDMQPFTLNIFAPNGQDPLDFTQMGVPDISGNFEIKDPKYIVNNLIDDPHPDDPETYGKFAELPRYYWLRTDLHNFDNTPYNNNYFFSARSNPFSPIVYDLSKVAEGKYGFKNFVANDEGTFPIYIWTPDRKHKAKIDVQVKPPKVEYQVMNIDDKEAMVYTIPAPPGDTDFMLTASDNRVYKIRVICRTQDGEKLLTGAAKGVSVCSGTDRDVARFTPAVVRPQSFKTSTSAGYSVGVRPDRVPADTEPLNVDVYYPARIHPRLGIDFNQNGQLDDLNREIYKMKYFRYGVRLVQSQNTAGFGSFYISAAGTYTIWGGAGSLKLFMYYRTENYAYQEDITNGLRYPMYMYCDIVADPETTMGWGPGAIYNSFKRGGYVFADVKADEILNFADALALDDKGSTEVYLYAEDVSEFGGLVGDNIWSNNLAFADVYGGIYPYLMGITANFSNYSHMLSGDPYAPRTMKRRYGFRPTHATNVTAYCPAADDGFYLDWDSFPANENYVQIHSPKISATSARTHQPFETKLLETNNFDLIYAMPNHITLTFSPSDDRDLPLGTGARIEFFSTIGGGVHESNVYGRTERSEVNPKATDVILTMEPTGVGMGVVSLSYTMPNKRFQFPAEYRIDRDINNMPIFPSFDSVLGLEVIVESEEPLRAQIPGTINITVRVIGSKTPASEAELKIEGAGVALPSKRCNDKGQATIPLTPTETGLIKVKASLASYADGEGYIPVGVDVAPPTLVIKTPTDYATVNTATVKIEGETKPGSTVTVNGQKAGVDTKGLFTANITLKEGANVIIVKATSPTGATTTTFLTVIRDTQAPSVIVNPVGFVSGATSYDLTGRVEPGSKVKVNGQDATVVFDVWTINLPVTAGKNLFNVSATDAAGNASPITAITVWNFAKSTVEFVVGNSIAYVDGSQQTMPEKAISRNNEVMVPAAFLANALKGQASPNSQGIDIALTADGQTATINLVVGLTNATINGQSYILPVVPEKSALGEIMIPARFVISALHEALNTAEGNHLPALDIQWNPGANRLTITRFFY